jgi:hypothetical protein
MKMLSKLTIAAVTVAALGAVAAHTIHAQVIAPVPLLHKSDAADAVGAKTYADWQGPLNQSFGARFLAHGAPWDPNGGAPSHGLTLQIFDGLDRMQVWHDGADHNAP